MATPATLEQWKELYDLAIEITKLKPWNSYWDMDLIAVETKKNEEPSMKDFMKTMIIPEIADKVLFLHRNRLLDAPLSQDAKLILAKNNSGWTGELDLKFYPLISKFTNRNE